MGSVLSMMELDVGLLADSALLCDVLSESIPNMYTITERERERHTRRQTDRHADIQKYTNKET